MVYFLTILLLAFSMLISYNKSQSNRDLYLDIIYFWLFILGGLRYRIGGDWFPYQYYSDNVETLKQIVDGMSSFLNSFPYEPGFKILCVINKSLGGNFQTLLMFIVAINIFLLRRYVEISQIKNKIFFVVLYFGTLYFSFEFGQLRQAIAFHIFMLGTLWLGKKRFILYVLLMIAATAFHVSVVVPFISYFILYFFNIKITKVGLSLLYIILLFFAVVPLNPAFFLISRFSSFILPEFSAKLQFYVTYYVGRSTGLVLYEKIIVIPIAIMQLSQYEKEPNSQMFIRYFVLDILMSIVFSDMHILVARFRLYFQFGINFIITNLYIERKRTKHIIKTIIISLYIVLLFSYRFIKYPNSLLFFPYKNYVTELIINNIEKSNSDSREHWDEAESVAESAIIRE